VWVSCVMCRVLGVVCYVIVGYVVLGDVRYVCESIVF
jgi:hypothetical protein